MCPRLCTSRNVQGCDRLAFEPTSNTRSAQSFLRNEFHRLTHGSHDVLGFYLGVQVAVQAGQHYLSERCTGMGLKLLVYGRKRLQTMTGENASPGPVAPGIKLYQITENGLALQATIQGTKYWKDAELNSQAGT